MIDWTPIDSRDKRTAQPHGDTLGGLGRGSDAYSFGDWTSIIRIGD
jgi:hypothetical protein